jgi:putative sterol carrier protein
MIEIQQPKDLLSVSVKNILSYRDENELQKLIYDYNKKIIIEIENFYPSMVVFRENTISFDFGDDLGKADLRIRMSLDTLLDLAYGRLSLPIAILTRKLKIKGIYKLNTVLRFKKIFLDTLKMVAKNPNQNYYELNQKIR